MAVDARQKNVAAHVAQTVETVASLQARAEQTVTKHQRLIERITAALGRPATVYLILVAVALWIVVNVALAATGGRAPDPPPFMWMETVATVLALVMTTMVLTTQNRQAKRAEHRAALDLQVNLLAEQKAAKLIALLEELRRDLPNVNKRIDPVADAMSETVDPERVMEVFEETLEATADPDERSSTSPP